MIFAHKWQGKHGHAALRPEHLRLWVCVGGGERERDREGKREREKDNLGVDFLVDLDSVGHARHPLQRCVSE